MTLELVEVDNGLQSVDVFCDGLVEGNSVCKEIPEDENPNQLTAKYVLTIADLIFDVFAELFITSFEEYDGKAFVGEVRKVRTLGESGGVLVIPHETGDN